MGLHDAAMANVASYAENSKNLVFPSQSSILKEIPLFLKFTCVEYSMGALSRGGLQYKGGNGSGGNVKAYISVPVPPKMATQTAMRYKQDENENFNTELQKFVENTMKIRTRGFFADTIKDSSLPAVWKIPLLDTANNYVRSFSQLLETDFTETILQTGSKRSFVISLYLPCLNLEDSEAAAKISRAFEALALPTMIKGSVSALGLGNLGAQLHFHPPMWFFNIGPLGGFGDMDWTSQPQASVLTNVAVTRTAIDTTAFTALDLTIKPIAYSITLNFQELESAFRKVQAGAGSTDFTILSRSAMATGIGASFTATPSGGGTQPGQNAYTSGGPPV
jgi:hypothetical protein